MGTAAWPGASVVSGVLAPEVSFSGERSLYEGRHFGWGSGFLSGSSFGGVRFITVVTARAVKFHQILDDERRLPHGARATGGVGGSKTETMVECDIRCWCVCKRVPVQ